VGLVAGDRLAWAARPGRPPDAPSGRPTVTRDLPVSQATSRSGFSLEPATIVSSGLHGSCSRATTSRSSRQSASRRPSTSWTGTAPTSS
jgi:hypothetical protein